MPTVAGQLALSASLRWKQERATTGFGDTVQGPDSLDFSAAIDADDYDEVLAVEFTLAAAASQTIDLHSFTNLFGVTVTAVTVIAAIFHATGDTGQLKIEPGAADPIDFWLSGTTPAITLECGPGGCCLPLFDGTPKTVSAAVKNVKVSNPGAAEITVRVAAFVGT